MTDAEIAKAKAHFEYGIKCDIFSEPVLSYAETVLEALDLINRQKAEIERLQKENNQFADIGKMYSEIKVETIKKFKHCVRTLFRLNFLRKKRYDKIFDEAEEMMLKEMAGDTE